MLTLDVNKQSQSWAEAITQHPKKSSIPFSARDDADELTPIENASWDGAQKINDFGAAEVVIIWFLFQFGHRH